MEVINKVKIDLLKPGVKPIINAMQGDENTRVIEVSLYANSVAWNVPGGVSFSVAYKKPDGTRGLYDTLPDGSSASSVDGNVASIRLAPQMLTVPGDVESSVVISSGEQTISTFPIVVNVIQNPAAGAVGSEDYFYSSVIGNLDDLKTTDKSSVVAAINEIFSTGGSGSDSGQNPTGGGLTTAQIDALDGMFQVCAYDGNADYDAAYEAFRAAFGLSDSGDEEEPDTPEKTLTSISAVYSGGDVAVGTAVTDLTGIVVTAHYSDGSTGTVTGYTLSGTISEGSNTITVSYGGKTTTFAVTGVAEETEKVDMITEEEHTAMATRTAITYENCFSDEGVTPIARDCSLKYFYLPESGQYEITAIRPDAEITAIMSIVAVGDLTENNQLHNVVLPQTVGRDICSQPYTIDYEVGRVVCYFTSSAKFETNVRAYKL